MTFGNDEAKQIARTAMPKIVRIGTHLFMFLEYIRSLRGVGRSVKGAISDWYSSKDAKALAQQITKYKQRGEYSHKDVLNLAHPRPASQDHNALFNYIINDGNEPNTKSSKHSIVTKLVHKTINGKKIDKMLNKEAWEYIKAVEEVKTASEKRIIELIEAFELPREVIPTDKLTANVYRAMLPKMPMTAMIRNLATMTSNETIKPLSKEVDIVVNKLSDEKSLKYARVHPLQILSALMVYKSGHGQKGNNTWTPIAQISDALEEAFYKSFEYIEPSGKNIMIALDVSGSMGWSDINGMQGITPAIGSAVMAMATMRSEKNYYVYAFCHDFVPLKLTAKDSLESVIKKTAGLPFGGTDCSLPMLHAIENKLDVDAFIVYTDSETWAGNIHPFQALKKYRKVMNKPNAKLIVVGMVANEFSIADPSDRNMLDVVGFSTDTPSAMSSFIAE